MPEQFTSSTKKMRSTSYRLIFLASLLLILVFISKDLLNHLASKAPDENFVTIKGKNIPNRAVRGTSVEINEIKVTRDRAKPIAATILRLFNSLPPMLQVPGMYSTCAN
jgi:hypothetical protein